MSGAYLLPEFDHEMAGTRRTLERVPDEHLDFRPHEKSFTLKELATHVANLPNWAALTLEQDELDMAAGYQPPTPANRQEILQLFDEAVAGARAALERADAERLAEPWTLRTGEEVHFTMPKGSVYRIFVMNHLVHHRGQLAVYLRLCGQPVPALYGPSADEPM